VHTFPPALVPVLRGRVTSVGGCLSDATDAVLDELLTTVFWAGLETYEGERRAIGVAFLGTSDAGFVMPEAAGSMMASLYLWKILRFDSPRRFTIRELAKLAVVGAERRIYSAVSIQPDGRLAIAGLAREGVHSGPDRFAKIIALRPGSLSVRMGREVLLEYERGALLTEREGVVFDSGPVRAALETIARAADVGGAAVPDYVDAVRSLVREMAAHGHGGILIVSSEERPRVASAAAYKMLTDSSLASLIRLARRVDHTKDATYGNLLRNAFLSEVERIIEEVGALTAIDGAVVLDRDLALVAFGVVLPIGRRTAHDLGSRGTRHRAAATFAAEHPGSVVFVASEDGQISCMFRDPSDKRLAVLRVATPVSATRLS